MTGSTAFSTPATPELPLILVADDSLLEQRYAKPHSRPARRLAHAFARTGEEVLATIAQNPPAVVLTDMNMPQMDGLTLTVERVREEVPLVPVVLMTGSGNERVAVEALESEGRRLRAEASARL